MYSEMRNIIEDLKKEIERERAEETYRTTPRHYSPTRMRPDSSRGLRRDGNIRIPLIGSEKRSTV